MGEAGNDILQGNEGNDALKGGAGNDLYLFQRGDNQDKLTDHDATANNHDVLHFLDNINHDQLWFSKQKDNLLIKIIGTSDQIKIVNWYKNESYQVEEILTADGFSLENSKIEPLVTAMDSLDSPTTDELTFSDELQQQLSSVLIESWL